MPRILQTFSILTLAIQQSAVSRVVTPFTCTQHGKIDRMKINELLMQN